jgi:hypothetical protein
VREHCERRGGGISVRGGSIEVSSRREMRRNVCGTRARVLVVERLTGHENG